MLIGALNDASARGSAYIFERDGSEWINTTHENIEEKEIHKSKQKSINL
jgi:hypothetical protein